MLPGKTNVSGPPGEGAVDVVASHQRLLIGACLRTTGPILELGVGWYSTPLLHEFADAAGRYVLTVDNNEQWLAEFRGLESAHHKLRLVGRWPELYELPAFLSLVVLPAGTFGVCLVDQNQPIEREYAVRELLDKVEVFVLHDTEEGFAYGYDRLLGENRDGGLFRYQYTDRCQKAWTTIASNVLDVRAWFVDLPPVEPTQEVT